MYIKNRFAAHLLAVFMTVVPATAYTNLNANDLNNFQNVASTAERTTKSVWFTQSGVTENTYDLISAIRDSVLHGLNPASYGISRVEQDLDSFVTNNEISSDFLSEPAARERKALEAKLYEAFRKISHDLGRGVLDAQKTQKNLYRSAPAVNAEELITRLKNRTATVSELLTELTPSTPEYKNLVGHMRELLKERDAGVARTTVQYTEGLTLGSEHASVIDLRARLIETGDLDNNVPLSTYFGSDVETALKAVQARNGITETGELTEATVVALNANVDKDIQEVAMNLERWRWMPRELGDRHILVNVPAYNLTMMNGDQRIADMPVIVGSKKHQTPTFSQGAQFVEVAPTWIVPASITNNELIPLELKKPGYLDSEGMEYFQWVNGNLKKVIRSKVTRDDYYKKPFPYVLRQRAGKDNALGRLKILMPNKHAIYLHDTQAKNLFEKTDRAFSHGCIRLSDPFRLARLLLRLDGKSQEESDSLLAKTKTTRVKFTEKTPTHISYFTAWVDDDGKLNKRKDVYKHNKNLLKGLMDKNTLVNVLKNRPITVLAEQNEK